MSSLLRRILALIGLAGIAALPAPLAAASLRVLFLGNSLTAGNDVPALVQAMAQLQGVELEYTAVSPGGYAIEDHWNEGQHTRLETGNFDVLILQQGPSTLPDSQANLRQWTLTWAAAARQYGTRPALYMVWPVRTQVNGFFLVAQSYRNAADAAGAVVFPAGEAWQETLRLNPGAGLYSGDDLHAMPAGSFLAAMVIARGLVSLDPARVPTTVRGISIPASTLTTFRSVVGAMPAATLSGLDGPDPAPGTTNPPATSDPGNPPVIVTPSPATPTPAPAPTVPAAPAASGGGGGGGGAPSLWFLLALPALAVLRFRGWGAAATRDF